MLITNTTEFDLKVQYRDPSKSYGSGGEIEQVPFDEKTLAQGESADFGGLEIVAFKEMRGGEWIDVESPNSPE